MSVPILAGEVAIEPAVAWKSMARPKRSAGEARSAPTTETSATAVSRTPTSESSDVTRIWRAPMIAMFWYGGAPSVCL